MPSREPTYYRWSQDKPVTTNQTYGFGFAQQSTSSSSSGLHSQLNGKGSLSHSCCTGNRGSDDDRYHHHTCVQCPDCAYSCRRTGQLCSRHQPTEKIITPSVTRFSPEAAVKPINKGYTAGQVPITKKLAASGRSSVPAGVQLQRGVTSPSTYKPTEPKGKDLYLWHALSGSLVHCKQYDPNDTDQ